MLSLTFHSSLLHGNHPTASCSPRRHRVSASTPTPEPRRASLTRRSLLLSTALTLPPPPPSTAATTSPPPQPDTTITDRVFVDFRICPTYFRTDRGQTLGQAQDGGPPCPDSEPMGRVVLGLYGKLVPITVANFKAMCRGASYKNTPVHKILPGQYLAAGRQGRREDNEVKPPLTLARNTESVSSRAFMLEHSRPGVVSLCLAENDDDDEVKLDPDYHNVEFLITTGPGPCPQLDGRNIIFGTVLEGLDVVTAIAAVPTYKPAEKIRQLNDLAAFLGDERAQVGRTLWNRPLKTIYISDCGELKLSHLFFADDLILFAEAVEDQATIIRGCLDMFCEHSGEQVNFMKSSMMFSKRVRPSTKDVISSMLSIPVVSNFGSYLGVPTATGRMTKERDNFLLDKVSSRLRG